MNTFSRTTMYVALATNEVFFETEKILSSETAKIANAAENDLDKNFIFLEDSGRDPYNALYVIRCQNGIPVKVEKIWEVKGYS